MTSPVRRSPTTVNENEAEYPIVKEYECQKGLKRVEGLSKEQLQNATTLGVLHCAVSILLSDKHLEFCVVFDTKSKESGARYHAFYFCGPLKNLEKCIQKKYLNLQTIFTLIHKNLTKKHTTAPDPYACPILIIGDSQQKATSTNSQAFWQVSVEDGPNDKIIGFIPLLHRTDTFHTLKTHPLISFEGEMHTLRGPNFILASGVDRNQLLPEYFELDQLYTHTLHSAVSLFKDSKWSCMYLPSAPKKSSEQQHNEKAFNVKELSQKIQSQQKGAIPNLSFVVGLSLYKKGILKDIDMASIRVSQNGRTNFAHVIHTFSIAENEFQDTAKCKASLDQLLVDLRDIRAICSKGVAVYNPFLMREEQSKKEPVLLKPVHTFKTSSSETIKPTTSSSSETTVEPQQPAASATIRNSGESLLHKLEKSLHVTEQKPPQQLSSSPSDSLLQKLARSVHTAPPANGHVAAESDIDKNALASAIVSVFKTYPKLLQ